ncbi:DUF4136 domain-containing protein [Tellurirhabdus rosea]|uniref:DUF4136 domain-containing protein n=1 Tax=Tellurirhabdus rosea TaxID=2674997 RepID=UPI0022575A65|nr:DUF4136 domain-containing protein [Tellurirhabdus rosea]
MKFKGIIASLFMVGLLASCAPSVNVKYDYDPKVNIRQFSTFRIEADRVRNADPIVGSNLNQRRIAEEIDKSMRAHGYKAVEGDADLVIRFFADSKDRQQIQSNPGAWNPWWGWGGGMNNQVYSRNYEENRIVVNVYDARSNEIVWQGWATGQLNQRKDKERDAAFRSTVNSIMKQFPESAGQDYGVR